MVARRQRYRQKDASCIVQKSCCIQAICVASVLTAHHSEQHQLRYTNCQRGELLRYNAVKSKTPRMVNTVQTKY